MKTLVACLAAGFASIASAGEFGVSPLRVDLDRGTRSALITVSNEDERALAFQIRAMQWTQDEAGADRYQDSADLVYFPRQLKIPPKERRVVRVGYKAPALQAEKAYRLYIEELADPNRSQTQTGVAITLRFGVPVFLRPPSASLAGEMQLSAEPGAAVALVRNTGNVHFRFAAVRYTALGALGETLLEQSLGGWYLLAGAERPYRLALPPALCAQAKRLRAEAAAEGLSLLAERALEPGDCR